MCLQLSATVQGRVLMDHLTRRCLFVAEISGFLTAILLKTAWLWRYLVTVFGETGSMRCWLNSAVTNCAVANRFLLTCWIRRRPSLAVIFFVLPEPGNLYQLPVPLYRQRTLRTVLMLQFSLCAMRGAETPSPVSWMMRSLSLSFRCLMTGFPVEYFIPPKADNNVWSRAPWPCIYSIQKQYVIQLELHQ